MITTILLTLKLASITTLILLLIGTPLAWWLSRTRMSGRSVIESIIALPLVLPPTVLGFYLLILFDPNQPFGQFFVSLTGHSLAFNFSGLVVGSIIYSLPFVVQPLQAAFAGVSDDLLEAAEVCGANIVDCWLHLILPLCKRAFLVAASLGFAHTVGEFGVVLMIGGAIPEETLVLSIALFDAVETLDFAKAHQIALGLTVFSLVALMLVYRLDHRFKIRATGASHEQ